MCFRPAAIEMKCPECGASIGPLDQTCAECGAAAERRRTGNARRRARRAWGSERPWSPRSPERPGGPGRARQTCCACSPRSPRSAGGKVAFGSPRSARDEGGFGSARGAGGRSGFREPRKREGRRRLRAGDGPCHLVRSRGQAPSRRSSARNVGAWVAGVSFVRRSCHVRRPVCPASPGGRLSGPHRLRGAGRAHRSMPGPAGPPASAVRPLREPGHPHTENPGVPGHPPAVRQGGDARARRILLRAERAVPRLARGPGLSRVVLQLQGAEGGRPWASRAAPRRRGGPGWAAAVLRRGIRRAHAGRRLADRSRG